MLKAIEVIAEPLVENTRISYVSAVMSTSERQKLLQEQYYFTCDCIYCHYHLPNIGEWLSCVTCSAALPLSQCVCSKCGQNRQVSRLDAYKNWRDSMQTALRPTNPSDDQTAINLYKHGRQLAHSSDVHLIKLAEQAYLSAINTGDMDCCVCALQLLRPLYTDYYPKYSIIRWNSLAMLSKALFSLDKLDQARLIFREAMSVLSVSYSDSHMLMTYMKSFYL